MGGGWRQAGEGVRSLERQERSAGGLVRLDFLLPQDRNPSSGMGPGETKLRMDRATFSLSQTEDSEQLLALITRLIAEARTLLEIKWT